MNSTSIIFPDITNSDIVNEVYQYRIIHVTAYIVHIDLQLRNEVIFRLTPESIDYLTKYHNEIPLDINHLSEKEYQIRKSQFVPEINEFGYRTHATALEGLEKGGTGELLCGKSEDVEIQILNLHPAIDLVKHAVECS
jgi:hypothetical protein